MELGEEWKRQTICISECVHIPSSRKREANENLDSALERSETTKSAKNYSNADITIVFIMSHCGMKASSTDIQPLQSSVVQIDSLPPNLFHPYTEFVAFPLLRFLLATPKGVQWER